MFLAFKTMSKFNVQSESTKVTNLAGGQAFQQSPKLAFVSMLLTSLLKDQYYKTEGETMKDLVNFIDTIADKKFIAKASIYARNEFGMRSITHVVAAELAKRVKGETWMRPYLIKNFHRADDMTETWSYYMSKYGDPVPNSLRVAVKRAFNKFDDYQLAKYRAQDKKVSMLDLINYTHPVATEKNKKSMGGIIKDTLKASGTWNAELASAGRNADGDTEKEEMKKEVWASLIKENKLPYFAAIRNIRNIVQQAPELIDDLCKVIENEAMLKRSLLFPFRFVTAVKQLQLDGINEPRIYKSLNVALEKSFDNVPKLDGRTLVAIDHSASMDSNGASKQLTMFEIGALFGITLAKSNNADIIYFGSIAKYAAFNPMDSTPTLINYLDSLNKGSSYWGAEYKGTDVGHGTNFTSVFQEANKKYDRICFFSDMQGWMNGGAPMADLASYKARVGANPKIYSFDLAGHSTSMFPEQDIYCLAGFSDKVFSLMKLMESDRQVMLTAIENVEL